MIQEIRRKSFRRTLPGVVILLLAAAALVFFSGLPTYLSPAVPVSQADMTGDRTYHVKDDVTYLYAIYVKETTTRRGSTSTSGYGYVTLTPDAQQFVGLWAKGGTMRIMDARWDDQDPYLDGTQEGDPAPIAVEGILRPLTGEDLRYYNETVSDLVQNYENLSDGDFARYVIDTDAFGTMWLMVGGAALALLIAVILLIQSRRSVANTLQKVIDAADDPAQAEASLNDLYHNGTEVFKDFRMNDEWFMHATGLVAHVIPSRDIVWAYRKEITTRHGLLMKTTSYQVCVADKAKIHAIPVTKNHAATMLETISAHAPQTVIGFNKELENLYRKDPANFIANAQAWSEAQQGETEQA